VAGVSTGLGQQMNEDIEQGHLGAVPPGHPAGRIEGEGVHRRVAVVTVHDVPLPAGSGRMAHRDLVPLTDSEHRDLHALLTGETADRFQATERLLASLWSQLGPADHET
jgi:hypothetical protein